MTSGSSAEDVMTSIQNTQPRKSSRTLSEPHTNPFDIGSSILGLDNKRRKTHYEKQRLISYSPVSPVSSLCDRDL
jgi:hypothetical protein